MKSSSSTLTNFLVSVGLLLSAPLGAEVLVENGGVRVSDSDVEYYLLDNVPEDRRADFLNTGDAVPKMVENMFILRVLAQEAENSPLLDQERTAWSGELVKQRNLVDRYRVAYLEQRTAEVDWDAMAMEAYKAQPERYMSKEQVRASHILVRNRGDGKGRALAEELRERALAGEDFVDLALGYTDDAAGKKNGGDLGFFARGQMVPQFEAAAFSLEKPGEISEVVESPFGYHVIKFHERKPARKLPFEEVKETIIKDTRTKMENKFWQEKIIAIRTGMKPHLDQQAMDELTSELKGR